MTVEGEAYARTLRITAVSEPVGGKARVSAVYGWYGSELSAVRVELSKAGDVRRLRFVSQLKSEIDVGEAIDGSFQGVFRTPTGESKAMQMHRMAPGVDQASVARQLYIVKPGADVPGDCAGFSGLWHGQWAFNKREEFWLWVLEVDARCRAKIAYQTAMTRPRTFEILDATGGAGVMPVPKGTLAFKLVGEELRLNWSSQTTPLNNGAALRRIDDTLP